MEAKSSTQSLVSHQQLQTKEFTYIAKYGCQNEYYSLKNCMREAEPSKIKSKCDHHYEVIGQCIVNKYQENGMN